MPRSFLGLSTEYWALPVYERNLPVLDRVLSLVHIRGNGPLVLRIGGDSAEHTFWNPRARRTPRWFFGATPQFLRRTAQLVRQAGIRLILDLNVVTTSPARAAQLADAAERRLPRASIAAFEIGNEPDIYSRRNWLSVVPGTRVQPDLLLSRFTTRSYAHAFLAYGRALAGVAPGVPLAGPAVANPVGAVEWIAQLISAHHPGLRTISAHRYLFSACARRRSPSYPTLARLLGDAASTRMARNLAPVVALVHRAGLRFRLTELNSVACGGVPGVSDAFVTALWAPDTLFGLLRAGVDGVDVHVRTHAVNAAFRYTSRGRLQAAPLLYGLTLFSRTLSGHAQLVPVQTREPSSLNLKAWAVSVPGRRLRVLLINKSPGSAVVTLPLRASAPARVQRLLAPSAGSTTHVTLAGQSLGADGRWHGRRLTESVTRGRRGYQLVVPGTSAALLTVRVAAAGGHQG